LLLESQFVCSRQIVSLKISREVVKSETEITELDGLLFCFGDLCLHIDVNLGLVYWMDLFHIQNANLLLDLLRFLIRESTHKLIVINALTGRCFSIHRSRLFCISLS
jgi:hypothetical protein